MTRALVIVCLALGLSGCIGSAVRDAKCQRWGATPGSPEYVNCMATLDAGRRRGSVCHTYGANTVCS